MAIKLRRENRLRMSDIAKIINTSTSFVGNVENAKNSAKFNIKHINRMAAYFKVSPRIFLPDTPIEDQKENLL